MSFGGFRVQRPIAAARILRMTDRRNRDRKTGTYLFVLNLCAFASLREIFSVFVTFVIFPYCADRLGAPGLVD
jgi:hypothetical protein